MDEPCQHGRTMTWVNRDNMGELWRHGWAVTTLSLWKKPDTKGTVTVWLCDSLTWEGRTEITRAWGGRHEGIFLMGDRVPPWNDKKKFRTWTVLMGEQHWMYLVPLNGMLKTAFKGKLYGMYILPQQQKRKTTAASYHYAGIERLSYTPGSPKRWWGCGANGTPVECGETLPFCKPVWQYLTKSNSCWPLLGLHRREIKTHVYSRTSKSIFITVFSIVAPRENNPTIHHLMIGHILILWNTTRQ